MEPSKLLKEFIINKNAMKRFKKFMYIINEKFEITYYAKIVIGIVVALAWFYLIGDYFAPESMQHVIHAKFGLGALATIIIAIVILILLAIIALMMAVVCKITECWQESKSDD